MRLRSDGPAQAHAADETEGDMYMAEARATAAAMAQAEARATAAAMAASSDDSLGEVEVVERPDAEEDLPYPSSGDDSDSEVVVVRVVNVQILAHPRPSCPIHCFATTEHRLYCEQCYCVICHESIPVCLFWNVHCNKTSKSDI
jgi:hypothetical protein